jgi:hypothetical protein
MLEGSYSSCQYQRSDKRHPVIGGDVWIVLRLMTLLSDDTVALEVDGDDFATVDLHQYITSSMQRVGLPLTSFQMGHDELTVFTVLTQRVLELTRFDHLVFEYRVLDETGNGVWF